MAAHAFDHERGRSLMHGAFIVVLFLAFVASHTTIVVSLAMREPRVRGLWALVFPPLAPYFAWTSLMPRRTLAWLVSLLLYALAVASA